MEKMTVRKIKEREKERYAIGRAIRKATNLFRCQKCRARKWFFQERCIDGKTPYEHVKLGNAWRVFHYLGSMESARGDGTPW